MASPLIRIAAPLLVGALAGVGAIIAGSLTRERKQHALTPAPRPLAVQGWWSSETSSSLAHAHPEVLIVDADTARLVDSWDRRARDRVQRPVVRRTPEWPAAGLIVVDAATGDLLTIVDDLAAERRAPGAPATGAAEPGAPTASAPTARGMPTT
ncbi:hypothetical protein SAMN04487783_1422 [Agrococcus baldri]|uniref:Uncharacterized protein n=1 Tax=Agrococcus baldri TaxID=153730 RepID=A0AA94HM97_9MICO|nr:hypothetical protein [Agrococcus baldri]SFS10524.1 hypothetical protein SAMN04487783_1422 [Agrococcus baldri]